MTYTVPSQFIGERLYIQLYDERLELFHGHEPVLVLPRVYAQKNKRARNVNYRHVIDSLVQKPQAFRYSQLREDLLPSPDYHRIWAYVDEHLAPHKACRYIVRLLHLAASEHCGEALGRYVLSPLDGGELPSEQQCLSSFSQHWESLAQKALDEQWLPQAYLAALCEQEAAERHEKRLQRYIREARLPPGKQLAQFDFSEVKGLKKNQMTALT